MVALHAASCHWKCSHAELATCSSWLARTQGLPRSSFASLFLLLIDIGKYCHSCTLRLMLRLTCIYQGEFEDILRERDAVRLLDGLDQLVVEASKRKQASESASGGAATATPIAYNPPPPLRLLVITAQDCQERFHPDRADLMQCTRGHHSGYRNRP